MPKQLRKSPSFHLSIDQGLKSQKNYFAACFKKEAKKIATAKAKKLAKQKFAMESSSKRAQQMPQKEQNEHSKNCMRGQNKKSLQGR